MGAVGSARAEATDSIGIYYYEGDSLIKVPMLRPLKENRTNVEFEEPTARIRFKWGGRFRFYFGYPRGEYDPANYFFSTKFLMEDFGVAELKRGKTTRKLKNLRYYPFFSVAVAAAGLGTPFAAGAFAVGGSIHTEAGIRGTDEVKVIIEEVRNGVYDVHLYGMPGEYCFAVMTEDDAEKRGVFDFTIWTDAPEPPKTTLF